eukprot:COSAG04_NODE_1840_length_5436_cov_2.534195_4_plen_75_part_00
MNGRVALRGAMGYGWLTNNTINGLVEVDTFGSIVPPFDVRTSDACSGGWPVTSLRITHTAHGLQHPRANRHMNS